MKSKLEEQKQHFYSQMEKWEQETQIFNSTFEETKFEKYFESSNKNNNIFGTSRSLISNFKPTNELCLQVLAERGNNNECKLPLFRSIIFMV